MNINNMMNNNMMNNNMINNNEINNNNNINNNNIMNNNNKMNNNNNSKNNSKDFEFSNILCKVIWIHKNKFKDANKIFISFLSKRNLSFTEANDNNSGIEEIIKIKFKCIYIIVSGSMFDEFVKLFQKNLNKICCIPIVTIFTSHKEKYQNHQYAYHPFYNPGGIHVQYDQIFGTLLKFDSIVKNKMITNIIPPVHNNECFNFEKIDSIPKLYFPFIYSKLIKEIEDKEINEFNKNILKYDNEDINKLIYPLTFLSQIPKEILVKFWLRIYTLETDFYSNMNCKLMKLKGKEFYTFTKLIYFALNEKYVKNRCDITLYRGDILNNQELQKIIDKTNSNSIKDKLIYSRKFLSFSSSKNIAENFINRKFILNRFTTNYVLFQINPFIGNIEDAKCYNIDMREYSKYENEEEYLFLPYSPFILESTDQYSISINNNSKFTVNLINLSYIGTRKEIIKTSMKNISSLDDLSFELLEKYFLDEIQKYKIFENEENIWERIKYLIKENDI